MVKLDSVKLHRQIDRHANITEPLTNYIIIALLPEDPVTPTGSQ